MTNRRCPGCKIIPKYVVLKSGDGWAAAVRCFCGDTEKQKVCFDTKEEAREMLEVVKGVYAMGGWVYGDE